MAFRLPGDEKEAELALVWRREMFSGAYLANWVTVETAAGSVQAITFVVNRYQRWYAGALTDEQTASVIASARGTLGTCAEYLWQTTGHLRELGVRDVGLERISRLTRAHLEQRCTTARSSGTDHSHSSQK